MRRRKSGRCHSIAASAVLLALLAAGGRTEEEGEIPVARIERAAPVDFEHEVLPILETNCLACHSSAKARGDLVLETPQSILQGGDEGPAVVPGKGAESLLVRVASHREKPFMPPPRNKVGARALTPEELGLVALWIDQGAAGEVSARRRSIDWQRLPPAHRPVYAAAVSDDGRWAAAGSGNRIFIYDLDGSRLAARLADPAVLAAGPYETAPVAHLDDVQSLAFHPDGTLLASGGYRCVKLWRRTDGTQVAELLAPGTPRRYAASAGGQAVAAGAGDGSIHLWNPVARAPARELAGFSPPAELSALAVSADGARIACAAASGQVSVAGSADGVELARIALPAAAHVLAFTARGELAAAIAEDGAVSLWSPEASAPQPGTADGGAPPSASEPVRRLEGHARKVTVLAAVPPAGERLVSGSEDGTAILWDAASGNQVRKVDHGAPVAGAAARADGKRIVTSGAGGKVKLWNGENGELVAEWSGDPRLRQRVAWRERDVHLFKARVEDRTKRLEGARKELQEREEAAKKAGEELEKAKKELEEKAKAAAEAAKGDDKGAREKADKEVKEAESKVENAERAAEEVRRDVEKAQEAVKQREGELAGAEAELKDAEAGLEEARKLLDASSRPQPALAFSPEGALVASAGEGGRITVASAETGRVAATIETGEEAIAGLSFAGGLLIAASPSGGIGVWSPEPAWALERVLGSGSENPFAHRVLALAFHPHGTLLATGGGEPSSSGELALWTVAEGALRWKRDDAHSDTVFSLEFSADGKLIASAGADKFVRVISVETGETLRSYEGHTAHVLGVSWQADGKRLASSGADNAIKVWNVETGEVERTIGGFGKEVSGIRFLADRAETVAIGGDRNVRMHRANDGNNFRNLGGATGFLYSLDVTADGRLAVAGGAAGVLRVWESKDGRLAHSFETPPE